MERAVCGAAQFKELVECDQTNQCEGQITFERALLNVHQRKSHRRNISRLIDVRFAITQYECIAQRVVPATCRAMPLLGASANVRLDNISADFGAAVIGRFSLKNSKRIEKSSSIHIADAQEYERAASKGMAAIGVEMGERALMARSDGR